MQPSTDDGRIDPAVVDALERVAAGAPEAELLVALGRSRLLVPVVATASDETGAEMATVLLTGRDGRRALLAFTCLTSLTGWRPDARPVPTPVREVAAAAVQEGADALVVDVAGPRMATVEGDDLTELAAGHRLVRTAAGYAWTRPASA